MRLRASQSEPADEPVLEVLRSRAADVGGSEVRRLLPTVGRRTVGPWCFLDVFGPPGAPSPSPDRAGFGIGPHPHTGLQTVTWLLSGEVEHRDSLGSVQRIRPGQLNWMTAGRGIVHAELGITGPAEGVQLWVALPEAHRRTDPAFDHLSGLPSVEAAAGHATVLVGQLGPARSPAPEFHPLVGAELRGRIEVALDPAFEHAVVPLRAEGEVDGQAVPARSLVYLGRGREHVTVEAEVAMLIGGAPLDEPLLLWWNFVERTHEDVVAARQRWLDGGFDPVPDTEGAIPPPPLAP